MLSSDLTRVNCQGNILYYNFFLFNSTTTIPHPYAHTQQLFIYKTLQFTQQLGGSHRKGPSSIYPLSCHSPLPHQVTLMRHMDTSSSSPPSSLSKQQFYLTSAVTDSFPIIHSSTFSDSSTTITIMANMVNNSTHPAVYYTTKTPNQPTNRPATLSTMRFTHKRIHSHLFFFFFPFDLFHDSRP